MIDRTRKMGVLLQLSVFSFLFVKAYSKEYIPVLVWDSNGASKELSSFSGLSHIGTDEFSDYFVKRVGEHKPLVAVFTEENLSVEDFSWRDTEDKTAYSYLSKITKMSGGVEFFPSVHAPYKALRKLQKHGYSWELYNDDLTETLPDNEAIVLLVKLTDPVSMEDRPDMLRNHDKQIATIYSKLLALKSHVIGVYTGHHMSWSDFDNEVRVRRDVGDSNLTAEGSASPFKVFTKNALFWFKRPFVVVRNGAKSVVDAKSIIGNPSDSIKKDTLTTTIKYTSSNGNTDIIYPKFSGDVMQTWTFLGIALDTTSDVLRPNFNIWAPANQSYSCGQVIKFGEGTENYVIFNQSQFQAFTDDETKFGRYTDCVMFFTAPIWSGILVVFILFLITTWGIIMIMDINTMDRFDDPKGKTITISASE